jgi:hypothetical protein
MEGVQAWTPQGVAPSPSLVIPGKEESSARGGCENLAQSTQPRASQLERTWFWDSATCRLADNLAHVDSHFRKHARHCAAMQSHVKRISEFSVIAPGGPGPSLRVQELLLRISCAGVRVGVHL